MASGHRSQSWVRRPPAAAPHIDLILCLGSTPYASMYRILPQTIKLLTQNYVNVYVYVLVRRVGRPWVRTFIYGSITIAIPYIQVCSASCSSTNSQPIFENHQPTHTIRWRGVSPLVGAWKWGVGLVTIIIWNLVAGTSSLQFL